MKRERIQRKIQKYQRMSHRPHYRARTAIVLILMTTIWFSFAVADIQAVISTVTGGEPGILVELYEKPLMTWRGNWTAPWANYNPFPLNQTLGRGSYNYTFTLGDLLVIISASLVPYLLFCWNKMWETSEESRAGIVRK